MQMWTIRTSGIEFLHHYSTEGHAGPVLGYCCAFLKPSTELNHPDIKSQSWSTPTGGRGIKFTVSDFVASFLAPPRCSRGKYISCKALIIAVVKINTESRVQEICFTEWWQIWQEATTMHGEKILSDSALLSVRLRLY